MADEPKTRRRSSLGWRILGWTLFVSAAGIILLLTTTMLVVQRHVEAGSNSEIQQEIDELRHFAERGIDSRTGKPFENAEKFLATHMARQQPGRGEIFISVGPDKSVTSYRLGDDVDLTLGREFVASPEVVHRMLSESSGLMQSNLGSVRWLKKVIVKGDTKATFLVVHVDRVRFADHRRTMQLLWPLGAVALAAMTLVALLLSRVIIRPLQQLEREVADIDDTDLMQRVGVKGDDEVAALAEAFNGMLDRVEGSFKTQRQFLDDASHELRTPITVVRGHLELMGEDPKEQKETISLVLNELDRMNRIVTDLLALAKAEQPDFIRCDLQVDVAQLTLDLDAKLMSLADRKWVVGSIADGNAVIDEQRVTQAVLQLAQNAVQHTDVGDTITLSTEFVTDTHGDEWLQVSCEDTGSGVPDEDKPGLFKRFRRGKNTTKTSVGAGLGLSIVHAIAVGHHGTVRVDDAPGGGALFVMRFPRHGKDKLANHPGPEGKDSQE